MPRPVVPTFAPARRLSFALVEGHVVRHDHVRAAADADLRHVDPAGDEHVQLADERRRVDHDPVPDDRRDVRVQDAGRAQLELHRLVPDHHRVAGVVAALVADDHGHLLREEVGGLAFALVPPLEADDHGRGHQLASGHETTPARAGVTDRPLPRVPAGASAGRAIGGAIPSHGADVAPSSSNGQTLHRVLAPRSLEDPGSIPNGGGRDTGLGWVSPGLRAVAAPGAEPGGSAGRPAAPNMSARASGSPIPAISPPLAPPARQSVPLGHPGLPRRRRCAPDGEIW